MPVPTIGVEEEFLVVEAANGAMVPASGSLLRSMDPELRDEIEPELNLCQVETATPVCEDLDDVSAELVRLRRALADAAGQLGLGVIGAGSHPFSPWHEQRITDAPRYRELTDRYAHVAREQVICGFHVHVGVPDADVAVAAMTRIRPFLPVVLALSANSPFWDGEDTGYASYRTQVWQRWPTSQMPPALEDRRAFDELVATLGRTGAIEDASHIYWYARPSGRYPTLEVRIGDACPGATTTTGLAGLVRAAVMTAVDDAARGAEVHDPGHELLEAACWSAARFGLGGELVDPFDGRSRPAPEIVDRVLDHLGPALAASGDAALVESVVAGIVAEGTGADRQRRVLARTGDPAAVVTELRAQVTAATAPERGPAHDPGT